MTSDDNNSNTVTSSRFGRLLTMNEVQSILNCGRTTIYELNRKGSLEFVKFGRHTRITERSLNKFIESLKVKTPVRRDE